MTIRLECRDLPQSCEGRIGISLGVQCRKEVEQVVPASARKAVFEIPVTVRDEDFFGPYVHGPRGERFIYLVWSDQEGMFRRAKIQLLNIPAELMKKDVVVGRLSMTDKKGGPLCASVRPPLIDWS